MSPLGELTILIPVDVSESDPPNLAILDALRPFEVVLLGYFPVPDQAEPALLKHEYEDSARDRLDAIAEDRRVTEVLVFTHDREATIDRVADQYHCDAVMTAGDADTIDRVLVPLRGDRNVERIVSLVAGLLDGSDATVTFFHIVDDEADPSLGESLLESAVERVSEYGVETDRIDRTLSEGGEFRRNVLDLAPQYDLLVLGETEPSLRERIIGAALSRLIDDLDRPALIVRDVG